MNWRNVTRADLMEQLKMAALGPSGISSLREWLRAILVGDNLELEDGAASLIYAAVERLDVSSATDKSLTRFAGDLYRLLDKVQNDNAATQLIPLIEERERTVSLLEGAGTGRVSRTAFLSYLSERSWPARIKNRIGQMKNAELQMLEDVLTSRRYDALPALVLTSEE